MFIALILCLNTIVLLTVLFLKLEMDQGNTQTACPVDNVGFINDLELGFHF